MKIKIKSVFLSFCILIVPFFVIHCCKQMFFAGDFAITVSFTDTANQNYKYSDSIQLTSIGAPFPNGDTAKFKGYYYKKFYLNPNDSVTQAELVYNGMKDTLTVFYSISKVAYDRCSKKYNINISVSSGYYTSHWLFPGDGKVHDLNFFRPGSSFNNGYGRAIQLYLNK
jgi:hypothetical protein